MINEIYKAHLKYWRLLNLSNDEYVTHLGKQYGKVCNAILRKRDIKKQLIRLAVIAVKCINQLSGNAYSLIETEMLRQNDLYGVENLEAIKWVSILGEEYGEACKAIYEKKFDEIITEMTHTAATAFRIVECLDRNKAEQC